MRKGILAIAFGLAVSLAANLANAAPAAALKVGYSDWPGWVAWQVAIEKNWIRQAGVAVDFEWFDYSASLDAFGARRLDAVLATNGDTLVIGAGGGKGIMVMVTDYSSGNGMIIAKPGIKTMQELKGQKIGVEIGLVDHLLLVTGLEKARMSERDVTLVNTKTNETPQVLASGQVAAVAAWQPNAGQAMRSSPGSQPIYTSAQAPGLIYDVLTVSPASLAARKADWVKLIKVWDRVVTYINDPKTQDDAIKIMAARSGVTPAIYKGFLAGTHLLTLADGKKTLAKGAGLDSLYGSTRNADAFNVKYKVYPKAEPVDTYIDPSLTTAALQ